MRHHACTLFNMCNAFPDKNFPQYSDMQCLFQCCLSHHQQSSESSPHMNFLYKYAQISLLMFGIIHTFHGAIIIFVLKLCYTCQQWQRYCSSLDDAPEEWVLWWEVLSLFTSVCLYKPVVSYPNKHVLHIITACKKPLRHSLMNRKDQGSVCKYKQRGITKWVVMFFCCFFCLHFYCHK